MVHILEAVALVGAARVDEWSNHLVEWRTRTSLFRALRSAFGATQPTKHRSSKSGRGLPGLWRGSRPR